jgi:hypothetical protein
MVADRHVEGPRRWHREYRPGACHWREIDCHEFGPRRAPRSGTAEAASPPRCAAQQTILSLLRPVGAEKKRIPVLAFGLAQQFIDVAVGQFARFGRTVEEVDDPLLLRGKAGNRGLKVIRPTRGRAQQPLGKRIVAVDAREEPCADRSPHRAAEHRVDHRVEDDVVDRADSEKEPVCPRITW